jgi:hypothetical protein
MPDMYVTPVIPKDGKSIGQYALTADLSWRSRNAATYALYVALGTGSYISPYSGSNTFYKLYPTPDDHPAEYRWYVVWWLPGNQTSTPDGRSPPGVGTYFRFTK